MWPFKPKILPINSARKPFITDMTIIKVATPKIIPTKENPAIIEIKPSDLLDFKYLNAIISSKVVNILISAQKIYNVFNCFIQL